MNTALIVTISAHTYLALFAGVFYYWTLLDLVRIHAVSTTIIRAKLLLASLSSILTWVSGNFFLEDFFLGRLGFSTDVVVTTFVPFYMIMQQILLPIIAIVGMATFFIFLKINIQNTRHDGVWKKLLVLSAIGFISGSTLMFLGVLVP